MPGGRPSELTDEKILTLQKYLEAGNYIETACLVAGVSKQLFFRWLKDGKANKSPEAVEFRDLMLTAIGKSTARDVALIARAADKDWRAAAWRLEHKGPFKNQNKVDVRVRGGLGVVTPKASKEELSAFGESMAKLFPDVDLDGDLGEHE